MATTSVAAHIKNRRFMSEANHTRRRLGKLNSSYGGVRYRKNTTLPLEKVTPLLG